MGRSVSILGAVVGSTRRRWGSSFTYHLLLEPGDLGLPRLHLGAHLAGVLALLRDFELRRRHELLQLCLVLALLLLEDLLEYGLVVLAVVVQALDLRFELLVEPPVPELQVAHRPLVLRPLRFEEGLAPLLDGFDLLA